MLTLTTLQRPWWNKRPIDSDTDVLDPQYLFDNNKCLEDDQYCSFLIMNQAQQPLSSTEPWTKMTRMKKVGMKHLSQNLKLGLNTAALNRYVFNLVSTS